MDAFLSYACIFAVTLVVVVAHEYGHYRAFRKSGIVPAEFSAGFGPKLFSFAAKGTEWSLRAIPLGGYVRPPDDYSPDSSVPAKNALWIYLAGPVANLALAALLLPVSMAMKTGDFLGSLLHAMKFIFVIAPVAIFSVFDPSSLNFDLRPSDVFSIISAINGSALQIFLFLVGGFSAGLFWLNLLPFPPFDGGGALRATCRLFGADMESSASKRAMTVLYATGTVLAVYVLALNVAVIAHDAFKGVAG